LQLVEPAQLEELENTLQPQFPDPRSLARELLRRDWLTPFQVNYLLQDRGNELLLGPYLLLERLGEGGLSQAYKARHQRMKRILALQVLREDVLTKPEMIQRFYEEIQVVS